MAKKEVKKAVGKAVDKTVKMSDAEAIAAMMGNAPSIPIAAPKKGDKAEVEMDAKFQAFIALNMIFDSLESIKSQFSDEYKAGKAFDYLYDSLVKTGMKPESFNAFYDAARCMFVHQTHVPLHTSTPFPLTQQTLGEVLQEHNIPHEEVGVPERLILNPEVVENQELLAKVSRALINANLGVQVVIKQEASVKYGFDKPTFAAIAKVKDNAIRKELFKMVTTISVKNSQLDGEAGSDAFDKAFQLIEEHGVFEMAKMAKKRDEEAKEAKKAAKKNSKE